MLHTQLSYCAIALYTIYHTKKTTRAANPLQWIQKVLRSHTAWSCLFYCSWCSQLSQEEREWIVPSTQTKSCRELSNWGGSLCQTTRGEYKENGTSFLLYDSSNTLEEERIVGTWQKKLCTHSHKKKEMCSYSLNAQRRSSLKEDLYHDNQHWTIHS